MIDPVPYTEFPFSNTAAPASPGPWTIYTSPGDFIYCAPEVQEDCRARSYCLFCNAAPLDPPNPAYNIAFVTNISIDLTRYGKTNSLAYKWEYWAQWDKSTEDPDAHSLEIDTSSSVGDNVYTDHLSFPYEPNNLNEFSAKVDKFYRHTGIVSNLSTNEDRTIGYLPISINLTFSHNTYEYMIYTIQAVFLALVAVPNTTNGSIVPSPTDSVSTASPSNRNEDKVSIGAVVGASIASAAFVAFLFVTFLLFRRSMKKRREEGSRNSQLRSTALNDGEAQQIEDTTLAHPYSYAATTPPRAIETSRVPFKAQRGHISMRNEAVPPGLPSSRVNTPNSVGLLDQRHHQVLQQEPLSTDENMAAVDTVDNEREQRAAGGSHKR
ncbi:hypothetical protein FRC19_001379 [Serendipita sp. 401]|nr:hypothetical protein FRC19_001379 [Serendipita sp. 401]